MTIHPFLAITKKEFGQNDKNGQASMTWKNREIDWYNAERRFIFAAPGPKMKAKWIKIIRKTKSVNTSFVMPKTPFKTPHKKSSESLTQKAMNTTASLSRISPI